jgi:crossover junction endodeoxyribonuclease RusA
MNDPVPHPDAAVSTVVRVPWPPKELSPNGRLHWARKAKVAKRYRLTCFLAAQEAGLRNLPASPEYEVTLRFHPPDRRGRDEDNLVASIKSGLDGLAHAMGVDDRTFRLGHKVEPPVPGGMVLVTVKPRGATE